MGFVLTVLIIALVFGAEAQPGIHLPGTVPSNPYEPLQHRQAFAGPSGMSTQNMNFLQVLKLQA